MYDSLLRENLSRVREGIERAAARGGRSPDGITLVAVTKSHPLEALRAALGQGIRDLGENRVEELEEKVGLMGRDSARWHMVGHVQSRKARQAAESADLIHSVDTIKLARKLSQHSAEKGARTSVLVQVNVAEEDAKTGFSRDGALEAIHEIAELPGLEVLGLMTMAPFVDEETLLRRTFAGLRRIHEAASGLPGYQGRELSMGMTNDFELAVEEGSTMVRIGTALFGERPR